MNLITAIIALIKYAIGDINIVNNIYSDVQQVANDSYYEFEIKNGQIHGMVFVLKGNVSVAPGVQNGGMFGMSSSKKYYLKNTTEASILYDIVSEKGHLGMLKKIRDYFKKNVEHGKGIDDLHFSSFAIIKSCESYSLMYPKYKKYCQFLKSFFKKYIDDLDNKTLAYMADVVDKSIKLLEQSKITIDNPTSPTTVKLEISKGEVFKPLYEGIIKNIEFTKLDGGKTNINFIGYVIHKDSKLNPKSKLKEDFKSYDTFMFNTAINSFNTSIAKFGFSNVIGDIKHTFNELEYYDKHKQQTQLQTHGGKRRTRKNRKHLIKKTSKKRISRKEKKGKKSKKKRIFNKTGGRVPKKKNNKLKEAKHFTRVNQDETPPFRPFPPPPPPPTTPPPPPTTPPTPVNQIEIDQDLSDIQRTENLVNRGISDLTRNYDDIFEYAFTYLQVQWSDQVEDSESNELDVEFFAEFFLDRFIENMATLMQTFIYETTLNRNINRLQEIAPYQGYGEQKLFNFVLHGERYNQLSLQDDLKNIIDAYEYRMQDSYFNFSDNFNQVDDLDSNVFYENNSNYNLITLLDKHREGGFEAFISNYFDLIKDYLIDYFENIYDGIEDDNINIANRGGKKNKIKKTKTKKNKTKKNKK